LIIVGLGKLLSDLFLLGSMVEVEDKYATILLENNQSYLGVVERSFLDSRTGSLVVRYIEPATSKILEIEI
jgi:hypothetical protein